MLVLTAFQNQPGIGTNQYRVKTVTNLIAGKTTEYDYTNSKTISVVKSPNGTIGYQYFKGFIVKTYRDSSSHKSIVDTFFLNNMGQAATTRPAKEREDIYNRFDYDTNGFRKEERMYHNGNVVETTRWFVVDGNEKMSTTVFDESDLNSTVYYTYYADKLNTIGNENTGMKFSGQSSKNLIKELIRVTAKGDTVARVTYRYHFDSKDRVQQKIEYGKSGALQDSLAYAYY